MYTNRYMAYRRLRNFILGFTLIVALVQCKTYKIQSVSSETTNTTFIPTLVINSILVEHQYEGNDSGKLARIEITGEIKSIPQWAFAIVPTLEEVKLAPSVKIFDDNAFFSCKRLKKINLNNVESIGENCFKFSALEDVNLAKATTIKEFAFSNCSYLQNIIFSENLKTIGEFAFSGDSALVTCHIPSGNIGASAFMGCSHLEQITFGKVVSIGNAAFLDCTSLSSVVIPTSVKSIGNEAFVGCTKLKEVIVNSHNTKIAEDAFAKNVIITYKNR